MLRDERTKFKPVSRTHPCEICGGDHKCARGDDGLIMCGRPKGEVPSFVFLGLAEKDPQFGMYRREGDPGLQDPIVIGQESPNRGHGDQGSETPVPPSNGTVCNQEDRRLDQQSIDWEAEAMSYANNLSPALRRELAEALGLPEYVLVALPLLGFSPDDPHGACWTFPEVDGTRRVVGIQRRYRDGTKRVMRGGNRGLTVPEGWQQREGPIHIPEGQTDPLALTAMGLPAIGRPSNTGGVDELAEPLKDVPADRRIVVVAEWDAKYDGTWPGRDGAIRTASQLQEKLRRPVLWTLPPKGYKDVREWVSAQRPDPTIADAWQDLGSQWLAETDANYQDAPPIEGGTSKLGFPKPVPASQLRRSNPEYHWIWEGYLARNGITLFSALWKSGKTTLLSHLLKTLATDGLFCGQPVQASRVLYVTEEHEDLWAERRDKLGLQDHVTFLIRPFHTKPDFAHWAEFLAYLDELRGHLNPDLIVFDTISNLWPVRDENDAVQVQSALMPLRRITEGISLGLVHHARKSDGREATAPRGSGALAAFVDTIIELRRFDPSNREDHRRVLTGYGRYAETPAEMVVELTKVGFVARGDRNEVHCRELLPVIEPLLSEDPPGLSYDEIVNNWPEKERPSKPRLLQALKIGFEQGKFGRDGKGVKGEPYRYWRL